MSEPLNLQSKTKHPAQRCYIKGCAKYGSDECTDNAKTCLMLERMRQQGTLWEPIKRRTIS